MALDPGRIVAPSAAAGGGFPAGELFLVCDLFRTVRVEITDDSDEITTDSGCARPVLARHAALLARRLLGFSHGLRVHVARDTLPPHTGLGSSSAVLAAVCAAVNELYGRPVTARQLVRFLVHNHGEEIDGETEVLMPVQCIGGSAAAGLMSGAAQVVTGDAVPILSAQVPPEYSLVLALPPDPVSWDAAESLEREAQHFPDFRRTGERHAPEVAYRLLHEAWPALLDGRVRDFGQLVFDYRFRMGSIENCSFSHPRLLEHAKAVEPAFVDGTVDVLGLSSVGPLFFGLTRDSTATEELFRSAGLDTFTARPWPKGYSVVRTW